MASAVRDGVEPDREIVEGTQPETPRYLAGRDRRPEVDRAGAVQAQQTGTKAKTQRGIEVPAAFRRVGLALEAAGVGALVGRLPPTGAAGDACRGAPPRHEQRDDRDDAREDSGEKDLAGQ